jgi:hypothetical protein
MLDQGCAGEELVIDGGRKGGLGRFWGVLFQTITGQRAQARQPWRPIKGAEGTQHTEPHGGTRP